MRFGLIDNRGMILVAAVLGVLSQSGFFANMQGSAGSLFAWLPWDELASLGLVVQFLLAAAIAVALVAATRRSSSWRS